MKGNRIALLGLLTALALVLSYLESLVPVSLAVPGVKMGLPNVAVVFALYRLDGKKAAVVSLLRVLLVSVLFGSVLSLAYSAAGAVCSLLVMLALKSTGRFGCTGVSVAGGVAHNAAQIGVAALLLETGRLMYYLPVLCVSGVAAGVCVGLLAAFLTKRIPIRK